MKISAYNIIWPRLFWWLLLLLKSNQEWCSWRVSKILFSFFLFCWIKIWYSWLQFFYRIFHQSLILCLASLFWNILLFFFFCLFAVFLFPNLKLQYFFRLSKIYLISAKKKLLLSPFIMKEYKSTYIMPLPNVNPTNKVSRFEVRLLS